MKIANHQCNFGRILQVKGDSTPPEIIQNIAQKVLLSVDETRM